PRPSQLALLAPVRQPGPPTRCGRHFRVRSAVRTADCVQKCRSRGGKGVDCRLRGGLGRRTGGTVGEDGCMAEGEDTRVLVLSFSPIASDARVLKQVELLRGRSAVTTCGYGPAPEGVTEHLEIPANAAS